MPTKKHGAMVLDADEDPPTVCWRVQGGPGDMKVGMEEAALIDHRSTSTGWVCVLPGWMW